MLAAGVCLAFLALQLGTDFPAALEQRFYDLAMGLASPKPSPRIAIIAADEATASGWTRAQDAQLVDLLSQAGAQTIVHTGNFIAPQPAPARAYFSQIQDLLARSAEAGLAPSPAETQINTLASQAQAALDGDALLSASLQASGKVLLPSVAEPGMPRSPTPPLASLGIAAAGVGFLGPQPDADGVVRSASLWLNEGGSRLPSLALLATLGSLNLQPSALQRQGEGPLLLGKLHLPATPQGLLRPRFYAQQPGQPAFAMDALGDVLSGKLAASRYAGKTVIIDTSAPSQRRLFAVAGQTGYSVAQILAHTLSSLLQQDALAEPAWGRLAAPGAMLLVAAYALLALPRLSPAAAAAATLMLLAALLAAELGLLTLAQNWVKLLLPAGALLLCHALLAAKQAQRDDGAMDLPLPAGESQRAMGQALQAEGQLDMAFERYRRAALDADLLGNLYSLALAFESRRQLPQARAVYQHMVGLAPDYKDVRSRLAASQNLSDTVMQAPPSEATPAADGRGLARSTLGRYQVEKELGKGAMGVVYLGRDPTIGRVVAIKTLALSQAFAEEDLAEARQRFFREAESAGRLQHPDIVTIYDAGEERGLAFIAMEFLKGRDLTDNCKPERLLPVATVLALAARVALALDYAHGQNVVHRDIKPANIMYEPVTDSVKVTDFGIARMTDASKTKTGLVMGTPSFMSPEQLAGKKVDGRSDLYSLGVMLYQLLCGRLPFRADSMSELMRKIASEEPADVCSLRPELPRTLADLVAKTLSKRPEARYQSGEQLAAALREVAATLAVEPVSAGTDIEI